MILSNKWKDEDTLLDLIEAQQEYIELLEEGDQDSVDCILLRKEIRELTARIYR